MKSNKSARHRQNKAQQPFARAVLASTRSAVVCRLQLIVQASGAKELAFNALTATRKTPLKHHLPFSRCSNGCSLLFRQCRFCLDITFADGKRGCFSWANTLVRPYGFSAFMVSFSAPCFVPQCRGRPACLPNGCAIVFLGRTHRFAPTVFPRFGGFRAFLWKTRS